MERGWRTITAILETWKNLTYDGGLDDKERENFWAGYSTIEKGIYEKILPNPTKVIEGTTKELAEEYETGVLTMIGFPDGINRSLRGYENPIGTIEEDTVMKIEIDPEKLYYNIVGAKADWLYSLLMWENILPTEKGKELYKEQKKPGATVKGPEVRRDDPCPCSSGLKYKKYCGRNQ